MTVFLRSIAVAAILSLLGLSGAHAALFGDDDARRAILELRQRVDANQLALSSAQTRFSDESTQLRRSLLDLQGQIELLRSELASSKGREEELARGVADLQRANKDLVQGLDERLKRAETARTGSAPDGADPSADPAEKTDYDNALASFRKGDFAGAQTAFADFTRRHPNSTYMPTALFWLGNSQYATRDYQGAIGNFRAMLVAAPDHPRAAEAALAIANSQIELKEVKTARRTLEDLIKAYPKSAAATAAADRLATMK